MSTRSSKESLYATTDISNNITISTNQTKDPSLTESNGAAATAELLDVLGDEEEVLVACGPGLEPDVGEAGDVAEDQLHGLPLLVVDGLRELVRHPGSGPHPGPRLVTELRTAEIRGQRSEVRGQRSEVTSKTL